MQLKLMLFCAASLGVVCLTATARAEDDSGESSDDTEKAEKADEAEERKRAEDDEPADGREEKSKTDAPRFEIALTTTLASDANPRPTVIGILEGKTFTILDKEQEPVGDQVITDLRAVGLDEQGRALYVVRIGAVEETDAPRTLRLKDKLTSIDVATEGKPFPGTDKTLISIGSQRNNRRGDVAFIAEIGRIEGLTTIVEEVRASSPAPTG